MVRARYRRPAIAMASAVAVVLYFAISFLIFPAYFQHTLTARHPAPRITSVTISPTQAIVGQKISIGVSATNQGDDADLQTVSVAFPNITGSADKILIIDQNFLQKPIRISQGTEVGSNYTAGGQTVVAQYPAIEAQSWPWDHGKSYAIDLQVTPQSPGTFVVLVKSVALPQNGDSSHYPESGTLDQQQEYSQPYIVTVKNH